MANVASPMGRPSSSMAHAASVALWVSIPIAAMPPSASFTDRRGSDGQQCVQQRPAPMRPRPGPQTVEAGALVDLARAIARRDCGEPPASPANHRIPATARPNLTH